MRGAFFLSARRGSRRLLFSYCESEMMRFLFLLLAFILVVPIIRMVMGLIGRAITNYALGPTPPQKRGPSSGPPRAQGGALHQDPVCGTYVSESVALKTTRYANWLRVRPGMAQVLDTVAY